MNPSSFSRPAPRSMTWLAMVSIVQGVAMKGVAMKGVAIPVAATPAHGAVDGLLLRDIQRQRIDPYRGASSDALGVQHGTFDAPVRAGGAPTRLEVLTRRGREF